MSKVAEQLRQAREARNLTVEQVADMTKLRTDHVRALEEGRFNTFSAIIYVRGSIKAYAKSLKLDEPKLLAALELELKASDKFSEPPPFVENKKTIVDHIALLVAKVNWKVGLMVVAVIAVAVIIGLIVLGLRHQKNNDPLKNLKPAVYSPSGAGDTLPLPKR